jgi:small conductance mechanosensitive channel
MNLQEKVTEFFVTYGFQLLGAVLILIAGVLVANWVGRLVQGWLNRVQIEPPVRVLLTRLAKLLIILLALVLATAKAGVDIAPMVAGIGVIGVGIGLATQGVLSNLVAGLTIIFTKPFRVGQYIEVIGVQGQVRRIDLFTTRLLHVDQSEVVIPNRKIVGEVLHNYGSTRQLELRVGVAHGTDLRKCEALLFSVLRQNTRVLPQPAPVLSIDSFGDSQIVIAIKPWVAVDDYVAAQAELYKTVVEQFALNAIEIPVPHRAIRVLNGGSTPLAAAARTSGFASP